MDENDDLRTQLIAMLKDDADIMDALRKVRTLNLSDGYIAAGFIRNFVWDWMHGYEKRTPLNDVDVVYYDPADVKEETEKDYDCLLREMDTSLPWSVKNQARMHLVNDDEPYQSVEDALKHWAETPTAVGVRVDDNDDLHIVAPFGLDDLFNLVLREGPFVADKEAFHRRYTEKEWLNLWPKLKLGE